MITRRKPMSDFPPSIAAWLLAVGQVLARNLIRPRRRTESADRSKMPPRPGDCKGMLLWAIASCCCLLPVPARQLLAEPPASSAGGPPNIVLIISDDQAWSDYGFMGHAAIKTPHLDELARRSVLFRRGYVPTSLCRPSLLTMITGRYAHEHHVTGNDPSPKYAAADSELYAERRAELISQIDRFDTLPKLLAQRGYVSHQSGKWWEGSFRRGGFTAGMTRGFPEPGGRHGDDGLQVGRQTMRPVLDFIDQAITDKQPFFVWYAPLLPHAPHNPPAHLLRNYQVPGRPATIAAYFAMCEWFDQTCGELISHLALRQIREKTLIVYVTDNGWIQDPTQNGFAPRSKQSPYEGGVRTPIMFSWPGTLKPADRPELVSSVDLYPTILSAAGIDLQQDAPQPYAGTNLWPALLTEQPIPRETIFGEGFAHDIPDVHDPEKSLLYRWCIEGRWKLILSYAGELNRYAQYHANYPRDPQLFDLQADPREETNVAIEHPDIVNRLSRKIADWYPVTASVGGP